MVTDPPYGVEYDASWRNDAAAAGHLAYAPSRIGQVAHDDRLDWSEAWSLFPGDVVYCWHAGRHASAVQRSIEDAGFEVRCQVIWAKSNFPISRGHYHWRHEPCWYAVRKGATAHWSGDRTQTTLWDINLDRNVEGGHSTQKPLECMARPIRNHGEPDDLVYDPFLGSGTTIIAAHRTGRRCYGLEIEPRYGEVILRRCEAEGLTVERAVL
jgi:DNA modification methylase